MFKVSYEKRVPLFSDMQMQGPSEIASKKAIDRSRGRVGAGLSLVGYGWIRIRAREVFL